MDDGDEENNDDDDLTTTTTKKKNLQAKPKVAVVGIGWWSQGWHLPFLDRNQDVDLVAIVDQNPHPKSKLNPNLEPMAVLADRYKCRAFSTVDELLQDIDVGHMLDGMLIATPHASHFDVAKRVITAHPNIHICMEKPLTTDPIDSYRLLGIVSHGSATAGGSFMINHSANYTLQARQARDAIQTGKIGTVRHITGSFASPLKWIFEEKSHTGWNEPTGQMRGNGFSWGQMCHLLGWIYHAVPTLQPSVVSCDMIHSETTGADIAVSATIRCRHRSTSEAKAASVATEESGGGDAVMSLSGTTLLPGYEHSEESVGKRVHIEIYGTHGALFYSGSSDQPSSGKLVMVDEHAKQTVLNDSFEFEQLDYDGHTRPESLMNWIAACQGRSDYYVGADCELGVRTVETVAAMYESDHLKQPVTIDRKKTTDALNF